MRFARPEFLWLLLAVPPLALLLWWSIRRRQAIVARFASNAVLPYLAPHHSSLKLILKAALLLMAFTGIVFAASRPQWGYEERKIVSRGLDIMVAIDTSNSMMARATPENSGMRITRLDRAKELLQQILWKAKGDRVGVIAFAGNAFVQCPLTLDYAMAKVALQSISVDTVPAQGTDIGIAIDSAVSAFKTASAGERILVLLTDGEDQGGKAIEAAQRAAREKVRTYTIGIGTTQAMPIPLVGGGYKQDKSGNTVYTKLDFDTLRQIASDTGGKAIKANPTGSSELDVIINDIDALQKVEQQDRIMTVYIERYQWFLLPAILLLIWESFETGYTSKVRAWRGRFMEG